MNSFKTYNKFLPHILTLCALLGIFFPLFDLYIHLIGTISITFTFSDFFQASNRNILNHLPDLTTTTAPASTLNMNIVLPFVAYALVIVLLVVFFALTFANRFKTFKILLLSTAVTLFIYAGIGFNSLPIHLSCELEKTLAYLTNTPFEPLIPFIDFSNIIEINLGVGYWLTLGFLLILLTFTLYTSIFKALKKNQQTTSDQPS